MYALKAEEETLLLLSRLNVAEEVLGEVRRVVEGEGEFLDYDRLITLAAENGVAPLLYKNLKGFDGVPADVINALKTYYYHTVATNTFNAKELLKILASLKANGIEVIPLKGSLASEIIFENPGLYPATDIDILVKPSDLAETVRVLMEAGYTKTKELSEHDLLAHSYHLIYYNDYHSVEAHWNLVKMHCTIPPDFWWEETTTTEFDGVTLTMLAVEKYLMYTIFRLYNHGFTPLKFLVLIAEISNKYHDEINWDKLLTYSEQYAMKRLVLFVLALLHDDLGTKIPEHVLRKKIFGYEWFKRFVLSASFGYMERPYLRKVVYTYLLKSPFDVLKVLCRRVFPDAGEIRLRYRLPEKSKKTYLYYVLNPFLVFGKRK